MTTIKNQNYIIQEAYCSFEVSKLLKEKGFPQDYNIYHSMVYNEEDYEDEYEVQRMVVETQIVKTGTLSSYPVGVPDPKCYAPTHQMAMRWLREVHDIKIMIRPYVDGTYSYEILNGFWHVNFDSYEDAVEAAIKYCLEYLIKKD